MATGIIMYHLKNFHIEMNQETKLDSDDLYMKKELVKFY